MFGGKKSDLCRQNFNFGDSPKTEKWGVGCVVGKEGIVVASEGAKALGGSVSCWLLRFINIPLFFQKEGGESENPRSIVVQRQP